MFTQVSAVRARGVCVCVGGLIHSDAISTVQPRYRSGCGGNDAISAGGSDFMGDLSVTSNRPQTSRHVGYNTSSSDWRGRWAKMVHARTHAAHLSVWPSRSQPCTPACCPPSGSTRPPWPAASCTRCRRSSAGGRRSPAPSSPPVWAGCPADTPRTWCRISFSRNKTVAV